MTRLNDTIENIYQKIPLKVLKMIRLFAILAWGTLAIIAAISAWNYGVDTTPGRGQDLYLSEIKEKMEREENLEKRPHVVIPDTRDLVGPDDSSLDRLNRNLRQGLAPREDLQSADSAEMPPFLGEKRAALYPDARPQVGRDPGVSGVRESTGGLDESARLFPPNGNTQESGTSTGSEPGNPSERKRSPGLLPVNE